MIPGLPSEPTIESALAGRLGATASTGDGSHPSREFFVFGVFRKQFCRRFYMLTEHVWCFLEEVWNETEESTSGAAEAVANTWSDPNQAARELVLALDQVLNCEGDESATDELIQASEPFAVGGLAFCLPVMQQQLCNGLKVLGSATMDVTALLFKDGGRSLQENIAIAWSTLRSVPDGMDAKLIDIVASRKDAEERHAVRCIAAQALGKIGASSDAVVAALGQVASAADEPQSLRAYCIEALMDLGPSAAKAIPALESILRGEVEDEDLRNFAWAALKSVAADSPEHPCGGTIAEHMRSLYTTTTDPKEPK